MRATTATGLVVCLLAMGGCKDTPVPPQIAAPEVSPEVSADVGAGVSTEATPPPVPAEPEVVSKPTTPDVAYSAKLPELYPHAHAKWVTLTRSFNSESFGYRRWVPQLDGVGSPMVPVKIGGQDFIKGWVCQPHSCGDNQLVFMMQADQSRIVGLLYLTDEQGMTRAYDIGNPDTSEASCLEYFMASTAETQQCPA